jgi:predicted SAM-dependent methyltransferase
MKTLVNVGCGATIHPDWINIDLASRHPAVRLHDLRTGLPFADGAVDVCYSSHVLEHLTPNQAGFFVREQFRVLKPGGIIRVVVPDLEVICRNYCRCLDALRDGASGQEFPYDYALLELYDQTVRSSSGGELAKVWSTCAGADRDHVISRHGPLPPRTVPPGPPPGLRRRWRATLSDLRSGRWGAALRQRVAEGAAALWLGERGRTALNEGLFRASGEVHRWMYDAFSLGRLLKQHGFQQPHRTTASASLIAHFADYNLDAVDGQVRKPGSLFMEAVVAAAAPVTERLPG